MSLVLEVYARNGTPSMSFVDTIDAGQYDLAEYADVENLGGAGRLVLPMVLPDGKTTNPALALVTEGRVVRFVVDGVDFGQFEAEKFEPVLASEEEEAGEGVVVAGREAMAVRLDKVKVPPDYGLGNDPHNPSRWFNHAARTLDTTDGPAGTYETGTGQLPDYDTANYFGRPEGFFDTAGPDGDGPEWIWDRDTRTGFSPGGKCYIRQGFTLGSAVGSAMFCVAGDDAFELWLDGVPQVKETAVYAGGCTIFTTALSAGYHVIAIVGENRNELRAGVAFAGATVSLGLPDTIFVRSDGSASEVLGYPASPPGFRPVEVGKLVIDEVQAAGRIPDVAYTFTATHDSASVAMDDATDIACKAPADSLLTLFRMLSETYLDVAASPGSLTLNAWVRGTRGTDLSGTLDFHKGNCRKIGTSVDLSARATVALVSGDNFAPFSRTHASAATVGYEEVALDFGDASRGTAQVWADQYLATAHDARRGLTLEVIAGVGPQPVADFTVGDSVGVSLVDSDPHRVAAIGLKVDASSVYQWTVELDQPAQILEERLNAIMRRQLPGSAGGRTLLPSPVTPNFASTTPGREQVHTWQWDGAPGTVQLLVNGSAVTGATVTAAAGTTDRVTVTDGARRYDKGVDKITFTVDGGAASPEWVPPEGRWIQEVRATGDAGDGSVTITVMVT